jgi:hypothetical protein
MRGKIRHGGHASFSAAQHPASAGPHDSSGDTGELSCAAPLHALGGVAEPPSTPSLRSDNSTVIPSGPRINTSFRAWKSRISLRVSTPAARNRLTSPSRSSTAKQMWLKLAQHTDVRVRNRIRLSIFQQLDFGAWHRARKRQRHVLGLDSRHPHVVRERFARNNHRLVVLEYKQGGYR